MDLLEEDVRPGALLDDRLVPKAKTTLKVNDKLCAC